MDLLLMSGAVLCILFLTLLYRKTGAVSGNRTLTVKAIVELDDRTHLRPERQRRDAIFNVVVAQAGIPLLRPRSVKAAGEVAEVIRSLA